jgi:phage terminase large subunit-like protein
VTPQQWQACNGQPLDLRGREVFAGLDLSETRDLTALVLIGQDIRDGCWSVQCTFWLPAADLSAKAQSDRVPYVQLGGEGISADDARVVDFLRICCVSFAESLRSAPRE